MPETCDTPELLPVSHALQLMQDAVRLASVDVETEKVRLADAVGRVTASDVCAELNIPSAPVSAMDGYALRAHDLATRQTLALVGTVYAGHPLTHGIETGQCVRIMTGAPLPEGADTVIMQEQASAEQDCIRFSVKPSAGDFVRRRGENIKQGEVLITKGTRLDAAKIALLASLGYAAVDVHRKLKVGVMATGDELVNPGETLSEGQIYESNRVMVMGLLQQFGAQTVDYGIVADDLSSLRETLIEAGNDCDLVITSGGVSVGEADFVKQALNDIGQVNFWKVAIKPGKPFAFGKIGQAWFCGLPGNPVSSYVTCQQLVLPLLSTLQCETPQQPLVLTATASSDIRKQPGRTDFQRGVFVVSDDGRLLAEPNGPQGSGIMTSVARANCYIVLEAEDGNINKGSPVNIIPFVSMIG